MSGERTWIVRPYAFDDHEVVAPSAAAAKYRSWKSACEAGYFRGRDGFWRYLVNGVTASPKAKEPGA